MRFRKKNCVNEELDLPCLYKVSLDSTKNSYRFFTNTKAEYEVLFVFNNSIFSTTYLKDFDVYHFVINKLKTGTGKYDPEIQKTINVILSHFFENKDRVLTYVYDSTDGRELVRKRMFRRWENNSPNKETIYKLEASIETEDLTYQSGIIYHIENKAGQENIILSFNQVTYELKEK